MIDPIRRFGARRAVTVVLALGLVAAVAVPAISAAQSSRPSPAAAAGGSTSTGASTAGDLVTDAPAIADLGLGSSDAAAPAGLRARIAALGRLLRGDLTVLRPDGSTVAIHAERGQITAVSAASITVKGADGVSTTFAVNADTKVRIRLRSATIGDLKVGDRATVFGTKDGSGYTAKLIRCARPIPSGGATGSGG